MNKSNSDMPTKKKLTNNNDSVKPKKEKEHIPKYNQPHMIIPAEDIKWSKKQKLPVLKLWLECWDADPYGSRMMTLNTELPYSTFKAAKKVIADAGLFVFKPESSLRDGRETVCWMVQNLHGSRVKSYWQKLEAVQADSKAVQADSKAVQAALKAVQAASISCETLTQQAFPDPSVTSQEHLSNSSKELLGCAELSASKESGTDSTDESPATSLNFVQGNNTSPKGDQELLGHFEAAKEGIMAPQEVMEELRNSKYWTAYVAIALANGWSIERPEQTMTLEARQMMEALKAKKKKPWL